MTLRLGIAAVVVGLLLLTCTSSAPIHIGVMVSADAVAGGQLAVAEINATGGIRGRALALVHIGRLDGTLAEPALEAAESLTADPAVIAVIGHSSSSASLSASQIYNARHIVQVAPTSSSPLLDRSGPFTFRLVASDVHQARYIAALVAAGGATQRTAVVYVNDDYGRALRDELRSQLARAGVPIVYEGSYVENEPLGDVPAFASAIAAPGSTLLIWLGRSPQLGELLPVLRTRIPAITILGSDGVDNLDTELNADGRFTGVRFVCFVDVHGERLKLRAFRERFGAIHGNQLSPEAVLTYDAMILLATAARAVGPKPEAIREYLVSLGRTRPAFTGASREFSFDSTGAPPPSYCLGEVTPTGARVISTVNGP
ncbi:MAG: ABC transporter substrate-binding protein [Gemmatimonadales bacterium]